MWKEAGRVRRAVKHKVGGANASLERKALTPIAVLFIELGYLAQVDKAGHVPGHTGVAGISCSSSLLSLSLSLLFYIILSVARTTFISVVKKSPPRDE